MKPCIHSHATYWSDIISIKPESKWNATGGKVTNLKLSIYGKLCNQHFPRKNGNKTDLDKIEAFLDDTFSEFTNRYGDSVDAEFSSRWVYPEEEIKKLVESLEDKDKVYIKILSYEFEGEYVSFRIFSQGEWKVKLVTEWVEEDKVKLWSILHFAYFYKRHTDGAIVGDFDNKITVRFICGKERLLNTVDKVIFTILQHRNHDTDSNEIRPMGCARIGKTER